MYQLTVDTPEKAYDIKIQPGLLDDMTGVELSGHVMILTNTTVNELYSESLSQRIDNSQVAVMEDGEQFKTLSTVAQFYDACIAAGSDRSTTILALGGGVVGDVAGFVAATYMRGVRLVQVPTSLLAMVDSSVGGKVGVDLPQGKNLVGAFKQPDAVLIDTEVLKTLPDEQWRCGLAEVLKHGLLADEKLLDLEFLKAARRSSAAAADLVSRAVQVKIDVVQRDPYEHNVRAHLNLGHTFAHAIEQATNYRWLHGDAVGVGLLAAVMLSERLGLCDVSLVALVDNLLEETGLPRRISGVDPDQLQAAMKTDKKWRGGRSRFIILRGLLQPDIIEDVPAEDVLAILQALTN